MPSLGRSETEFIQLGHNSMHHLYYPLLIRLIPPCVFVSQPAQQTRIVLEGDLGRAPTDEEWARACSVPIQVLKRQMEVYEAARNKLLTVSPH